MQKARAEKRANYAERTKSRRYGNFARRTRGANKIGRESSCSSSGREPQSPRSVTPFAIAATTFGSKATSSSSGPALFNPPMVENPYLTTPTLPASQSPFRPPIRLYIPVANSPFDPAPSSGRTSVALPSRVADFVANYTDVRSKGSRKDNPTVATPFDLSGNKVASPKAWNKDVRITESLQVGRRRDEQHAFSQVASSSLDGLGSSSVPGLDALGTSL